MRKLSRRAMAVILSSSMILPLTACNNKKNKNNNGAGQSVVKEDDPYFAVKKADVTIPVDPDKEVDYQNVDNMVFLGDSVMVSYSITYKMSPEAEKKIQDLDWEADDACDKMLEITAEFNKSGTLYFDLDGNLIKKEESGESESISKVYQQKDGSFLKLATVHTQGDCVTKTKLYDCEKDGTVRNEIFLEDTEEMWQSSIFRTDDGNYLVGSGINISLMGKDGKLLHREEVEGFSGMIYFFDGKYYASIEKFDDKNAVSNCYYQEIDLSSGTFKGDPIKGINSYWQYIQGTDKCYTLDVDGISSLNPIDGKKKRFWIGTGQITTKEQRDPVLWL